VKKVLIALLVSLTLVVSASASLGPHQHGSKFGPWCVNKTTGVIKAVVATQKCLKTEYRVKHTIPQGAQGFAGPTGLQGSPGDAGSQGGQGDQGAQGPVGLQGPVGAQGPKGDVGATGATGPQGPAGADGSNAPGTPQAICVKGNEEKNPGALHWGACDPEQSGETFYILVVPAPTS
jgi:hypothetical protein